MDNIKEQLLEYFIKNPEKEFYVRELSKLIKKSPTTVSKYLFKLKKEEILTFSKNFNHLLFKSNLENKSFKLLKLSYNLNILTKFGLIEYLIDKFNNPEAILLFGSFRKAENTQKSDIDILIITPLKIEINLTKFEDKLGHKIQLFIHSNEEINKMKLKNKELLNSWINGIVLYGFWEVFK